jgi:phosphate transport system protein
MRQTYDEQLRQLEARLLQFGTFVQAMLDKAMRALVHHDVNLAREVVADDDTSDDMDLEIEHLCMHLIAQQQPVGADLRAIGSTLKVIADVERIGDYSKDIAKIAIALADTEYFKPLVDIPRMADMVREMLHLALEALVNRDLDLVQRVMVADKGVDQLWRSLRQELETIMQARPELVPQAVSLLLVARYLERIGDHTENIVERVAYVQTGSLDLSAPAHPSPSSPS